MWFTIPLSYQGSQQHSLASSFDTPSSINSPTLSPSHLSPAVPRSFHETVPQHHASSDSSLASYLQPQLDLQSFSLDQSHQNELYSQNPTVLSKLSPSTTPNYALSTRYADPLTVGPIRLSPSSLATNFSTIPPLLQLDSQESLTNPDIYPDHDNSEQHQEDAQTNFQLSSYSGIILKLTSFLYFNF